MKTPSLLRLLCACSHTATTKSAVATVTLAATPERRRWRLATGPVAAVLAGAVGVCLLASRATSRGEPATIVPFTADGGAKKDPALSPDGETVAYSWAGPADDNWDIYVKGLGVGAKPLRLTQDPAHDRSPVWSPDGRQVAFVRDLDEGPAIYTARWPSGQERRLIQLTGPTFAWGGLPFLTTLSWSPDGDWLAFAEKPSEGEPARIVRLTLATLDKQPLTSPPQGSAGDIQPAYSPDGTQLAFVRSGGGDFGNNDVWIQSLQDGEARRVTFGLYDFCWGLSWTADGRELLFSKWPAEVLRVSRVSVTGGDPQPVPGVGQNTASASARGNRMVFEQRSAQTWDIWRLPGRTTSLRHRVPAKLIASSGDDLNPTFSPDGQRIAFESSRGGTASVWVCDSDGSGPVQLTTFTRAGTPRWSPDGRRIVFDSNEAGDWNLYTIDAEGGMPQRLTQAPSADFEPFWSHDGQWIYFSSDRGGSHQIWKTAPDGGQAVQVTRGAGAWPTVSRDSHYLYYQDRVGVRANVWRTRLDAGQDGEPVDELADILAWALGQDGIYFTTDEWLCWERNQRYTISYLDFKSGEVTELFSKVGPYTHVFLAASPDEAWLLYGEAPLRTRELMLMESFR